MASTIYGGSNSAQCRLRGQAREVTVSWAATASEDDAVEEPDGVCRWTGTIQLDGMNITKDSPTSACARAWLRAEGREISSPDGHENLLMAGLTSGSTKIPAECSSFPVLKR